jgi:ribonuclease VapC
LKIRVLDSWPIIEWINAREPVLDLLDRLLAEAMVGNAKLYISGVNVGEVYYFLRKERQFQEAEFWKSASLTLPMTIDVPAMNDIWRAAELKAQFPISYADAFAAALAAKYQCPLITGDPEFKLVAGLELDWVGSDSKKNRSRH